LINAIQRKSVTFFVEGIDKNRAPEAQVRRIGEYAMTAEAITAAQKTVEAFLLHALKPGMDGKALFSLYREHGEHPFIFRSDDKTYNVPGFNHAQYAMKRAAELCGGKT
jgi:hypothetical protein